MTLSFGTQGELAARGHAGPLGRRSRCVTPVPSVRHVTRRTVSLVTLGCARNEVDSEELAARLTAAGWELTADDDASVVLVNTCGFIQAAKQESIDELLAAADSGAKVVAVGCLAERYGAELAEELPEAQVLSFDDYGEIGARLDDVLAGRSASRARAPGPPHPAAHLPGRARQPRPAPSASPATATLPDGRGPAPAAPAAARRLSGGPVAPLKIASGCDRRCSFCAIPAFRGAFVSRRPPETPGRGRAGWPPGRARAGAGQRELHLLRQGPGQPAAARGGAARPGRDRGHRAGRGSATCSPPSCGRG